MAGAEGGVGGRLDFGSCEATFPGST